MHQEQGATPKQGTGKPFVDRHLWEIQPLRDLAVIALALLLIQLGYMMRVVTVPLLLGLLFAYLFEPLVARVAKRTGRSLAAVIILLAAYVLIGVPALVGTGLGAVQAVALAEDVRADWPKFEEKIVRTLEAARRVVPLGVSQETGDGPPADEPPTTEPEPGAEPPAVDTLAQPAPTPVMPVDREQAELSVLFQTVRSFLAGDERAIGKSIVGGGVAAFTLGWRLVTTVGFFVFNAFFLVPFFFYFCSVGLDRAQRFGVSAIPRQKRESSLRLLHKMDTVISAFIRGRLTICLILAVMFTVGFAIARVPAPFVIGPIVGLLAFVPYLGIVGCLAAIIMLAVTQAGEPSPMAWWWIILGPTIAYWACQWIDDYILTPMIQGKQTGLDTPLILISVLGAAALAGVYGILVAIPVAACVKILVTDVFWPRYRAWAEGRAEDPLPIGHAPGDKAKG